MKPELHWPEPNLPTEAWGYYGEPQQSQMFCKIYQSRPQCWVFMRSRVGNRGYDLPKIMGGVEDMAAAKATAEGYYLLMGEPNEAD